MAYAVLIFLYRFETCILYSQHKEVCILLISLYLCYYSRAMLLCVIFRLIPFCNVILYFLINDNFSLFLDCIHVQNQQFLLVIANRLYRILNHMPSVCDHLVPSQKSCPISRFAFCLMSGFDDTWGLPEMN